jgi:transposase
MARYKAYSYEQKIMIPVSLENQILPGTFEHTLNVVIDEMDLSTFDARYRNDKTGASAYDPAILLKVILFSYSKGIISSRKIAQLCEENIVCMALSADSHPHFTTIADFVSSMGDKCVELFTKVLAVCYSENLIGKQMFAIDGCTISSNCSKEWSGTKAELLAKVGKIEKSVEYLVTKHKSADLDPDDPTEREREKESIRKLKQKAAKITGWLGSNEDKLGAGGTPVKSNIIDNDSAKLATSHGVIQGYNGIAAVDDKHQTVVWAGVYGDSNESGHLPKILEEVEASCRKTGIGDDILRTVKITADTGYHSEQNMKLVCEKGIEAYIPDRGFRTRDVRFKDAGKYKKKVADWQPEKGRKYFGPRDFVFSEESGSLRCPAGKPMWLKTPNFQSAGGRYKGKSYMGHTGHCGECELRSRCIRNEHTKARQVTIFDHSGATAEVSYTVVMRKRIDTAEARSIYSKRMGTVEPVFGHLAGTKRLNRFTLRGKDKVNTQWMLYCVVHNLGKIQKYGA